MAIQHRRGNYDKFDPGRMVDGEIAVVKSGDPDGVDNKAIYMTFAPGDVQRVATAKEVQNAKAEAIAETKSYSDKANKDMKAAAESAERAKIWAVGKTNKETDGSDTNNSEYWAEKSKEYSDSANEALNRVTILRCEINSAGHLIVTLQELDDDTLEIQRSNGHLLANLFF